MASRATIFAGGRTGRANTRSVNALLTNYKAFKDVVDREALRIVTAAADMILETTLDYVPVDTGALQESGKAFGVMTSKGPAAFVVFGGSDNPVTPTRNAPDGIVDYAIIVHENLEKGILEAQGDVDSFIKSELRKLAP
jgi:hypothetical protein